MKYLLEDGATEVEIVETDHEQFGNGEIGSAMSASPRLPAVPLSSALKPVEKFCEEALGRLRSAANADRFEIEFEVVAGSELGLWGVAKTSGKGTLKVKARWNREAPSRPRSRDR